MSSLTNQSRGFFEARRERLLALRRERSLSELEKAELDHAGALLRDEPTDPAFGYSEGNFYKKS